MYSNTVSKSNYFLQKKFPAEIYVLKRGVLTSYRGVNKGGGEGGQLPPPSFRKLLTPLSYVLKVHPCLIHS